MDKTTPTIRFGADGWHARYDGDFTADSVARLASGLGALWAEEGDGPVVYVGYDTRPKSKRFAAEVAGILASFGLDVRLSDSVCPTPAVGFACSRDDAAAGGVIVTASKRSAAYGGIVIRGPRGGSRPTEFYEKLERIIPAVPTEERAPYTKVDLLTPYLEALVGLVDADAIAAAGLHVVVDPMYGATKRLVGPLFERLGIHAHLIHTKKSAEFGGIHPEPIHPWTADCEQVVFVQGADLGLVFDGDGDRAAVVDDTATLLTPHQLTPLVLEHLVRNRGMMGRVVTTLSSSIATRKLASELGCPFTSVPVGFSRLYREMLVGDVLLAAEEYGGIALPFHFWERDALLVCLLICEMLAKTGKSLSELREELAADVGDLRYARRDVRLDAASCQAFRNILPGLNPQEVAGDIPREVSHADGLRLEFGDGSWVLMRPSRMDPIVRIYSEAPTIEERDAKLDAACFIVSAGLEALNIGF